MRIALIGGGPSALYTYQRLVQSGLTDLTITIYERGPRLGPGMPYSPAGANPEHLTNVGSCEVPALPQTLAEWAGVDETEVVPRLLFGDYLAAQFEALLQEHTTVHLNTELKDVPQGFDHIIICTGHRWPRDRSAPRYYDSPYPPSKLPSDCNHPVAIRGSSLTAVDAVLTLALRNAEHPDFKLVLHTRGGLLPSVRGYLQESGVNDLQLPSPEEIERIKSESGGHFPLDLLYREYFVKHSKLDIKHLTMEEFVEAALHPRERYDSFAFLEAELEEATRSEALEEPIAWKEALALFNYAANYPAKHFSAHDLERLTKTLRPLVAVIIAHLPKATARQLLRLHKEGRLELVEVGEDSRPEEHPEGGVTYEGQHYRTFVDCVGQPAIPFEEFPFPSLHPRQARVDGQEVPGVAVDDDFLMAPGVFLMAVPYMAGHNPDYSGLDFCDEAARRIVERILSGL